MALTRTLRVAVIATVVAGIGLTACGGDDNGSTASTSTPAVPTTSSGAPGTTSTAPAARVAAFAYAGGKVSGDSRVTVKLGQQVTIRVMSDVAEEVHVHTYDRKVELEPGVPGDVTFTADIPGVHEVELEGSGLHLTSLEVQ